MSRINETGYFQSSVSILSNLLYKISLRNQNFRIINTTVSETSYWYEKIVYIENHVGEIKKEIGNYVVGGIIMRSYTGYGHVITGFYYNDEEYLYDNQMLKSVPLQNNKTIIKMKWNTPEFSYEYHDDSGVKFAYGQGNRAVFYWRKDFIDNPYGHIPFLLNK